MENKNGRPASTMASANKELSYMVALYKKYNNSLPEIRSALGVSHVTLFRWNTGASTPHTIKHLSRLEELTGFTAEEIKLQHIKLNLCKQKNLI